MLIPVLTCSSGGMLSVLDDMCLRPGSVEDSMFLDTLNRTTGVVNHNHFESRSKREFYSDSSMSRHDFRLVHYAGKVTYNIDGFVSKNKDTLFAVFELSFQG